jgi:aminoglycoside phosphotransferase (APT) family kinase protein
LLSSPAGRRRLKDLAANAPVPVPDLNANSVPRGRFDPMNGDTPRAAASGDAGVYREIHDSLERMALVGAHQQIRLIPLAGGVSSDIWRVETPASTFCVKRALARLKVEADWQVPVGRNRHEVAWFRAAGAIAPEAVPAILGDDEAAGAFAMSWLAPESHPVWKALLRDGAIDPATARAVGAILGRIHAATADRPGVAAAFATDATFHAIRLEPYLEATGRAHPDLRERFDALVATTAATKRALVHGDFSPKNLLIGPASPVILDAECAWFGDPAFDLAFVLNHLLLNGAWRPQWRDRYLAAFAALVAAYRDHVAWEPWAEVERRTAALLPALLLARIDGKSPVEYLTTDRERDAVRAFARPRIATPPASLAVIASDWSGSA